MIYALACVTCALACILASDAFVVNRSAGARVRRLSASVEDKQIVNLDAPDFYWEYRLERLASKQDLKFSAVNYPDVQSSNFKDLYDAYYLDLTLQGKLGDSFDWEEEKKITDNEWQEIYKNTCNWTSTTAKVNKPDTSNLPSNDFDLLKQFYPQLNFRDLEQKFAVEEVGANFPYTNMKSMLQAALDGKLAVPGYDKSITKLEATDAKAKLAALKAATMAKLDAIQADAMAFATTAYPDEHAKTHYQALQTKLGNFPQGAAGWADSRAKMEVEVDEMAKLASKKVDEHHGHEEEGEHGHAKKVSPAEEFEAKYGRNLDLMQERMNQYKNDPKGFMENSILEKFGQKGLDVWQKSESFSSGNVSAADKAAAEKAFADFLKNA
jgi:hypothetical protein